MENPCDVDRIEATMQNKELNNVYINSKSVDYRNSLRAGSADSNETVTLNMGKDKEKVKTEKKEVISEKIVVIVHFCVLLFVLLIVYCCVSNEFVFFTWHPLLLSIGWMLLMTEGLLVLHKNTLISKKFSRGHPVFLHQVLMSVGVILTVLGFAIVYINKSINNKGHFKSWHSIFGLLGVLFAVPVAVNGFAIIYSKMFKPYVLPKTLKFIHILSGTLSYIFGGLSLILSVYTNWFAKRSHSNLMFYLALILVSTVVIWSLVKPINSSIKRFYKAIG